MSESAMGAIILFIAALVAAALAGQTLVGVVSDLSHDVQDVGDQKQQALNTNFEIISDAGSGAIYNNTSDEVTILVKNTGSTRIAASPKIVSVLFDGEYVSNVSIKVINSSSGHWVPGKTARITFTKSSLSAGEHQVAVHAQSNQDDFVFYYNP